MAVLLGGLGGGGDVGLALILAESAGLKSRVWASFAGCSPERAWRRGHRPVVGSLVRPVEYHYRNFEWALQASGLAGEAYRICVWTGLDRVLEGLRWLARKGITCALYTDIGGDGLLAGYESMLGSYRIDTLARAALAVAVEQGVIPRAVLAVGGIGLEGGARRTLNAEELAATLLYYWEKGSLIGACTPSREAAEAAWRLLHPIPGKRMTSVMLPLYLGALQGRTTVRIADPRAYSQGAISLDPWSSMVFLLDPLESCRASPLCSRAMKEWTQALEGDWQSPPPPREWREALRRAKKMGPERVFYKLYRLLRPRGGLREFCGSQT